MWVVTDSACHGLDSVWADAHRFQLIGSCVAIPPLKWFGHITLIHPGKESLGGMAAYAASTGRFIDSRLEIGMCAFFPLLETTVPERFTVTRSAEISGKAQPLCSDYSGAVKPCVIVWTMAVLTLYIGQLRCHGISG
jgi:hypothetical protein